MKIYGISGLGADKRVFDLLDLNCEFIPIEWIEHRENESLKNYSERLAKVIDTTTPFGILGVSFGGLVAVEISHLLDPCLTILISSAETKSELRPVFRGLGKLHLLKAFPPKAFDLPRKIARFVFGTANKELLNSILDDTDLNFAKWAVNQLICWDNENRVKNVLRIHGTQDRLLPWNSPVPVNLITGGGHFMVVDRAGEISAVINEELKKVQYRR